MSMPRGSSDIKPGFSLVEVLLSVALLAILSSALIGAYVQTQQSAMVTGNRSHALMMAEEGLEASRSIRDSGFNNLAIGSHGLAIQSNTWSFQGTSDTSGLFQRQVTVSRIDSSTVQATATVTWPQTLQRSGQVSLVTYFTNWSAKTVGDWSAPRLVGSFNVAGTQSGQKIKTAGNYAYMIRASGTPNFIIFNITDPVNPTVAGSMTLSGTPTNLDLAGNYVYVSSGNNASELQVIYVGNPASPTLAGTYDASGNPDANSVAVLGNQAYLVRNYNASANNFLVINLTFNETLHTVATSLLGSTSITGNAMDVMVLPSGAQTYGYVASADNNGEFKVVNVTNPAAPVLVAGGVINLNGTNDAIAIAGYGSVVAISQLNSLYLVNVTNPLAPVLYNSLPYNAGGLINDIEAIADLQYAFLGTSNASQELQILNIANPVSPAVVSAYNIPAPQPASDPLNGVAYNASLDRLTAAANSGSGELLIFGPP